MAMHSQRILQFIFRKMAATSNGKQLRRIILLYLLIRRIQRRKYFKSKWVRKLFVERKIKGEFWLLIKDMELYDHEYFFKSFRMSPTSLEQLLSWIGPRIFKSSQRREAISPKERLCVTLRYLVTGDAQVTIAASYRIGPATISKIIKETTKAIWDVLDEKGFLRVPRTAIEWKAISKDFKEKWNFPNCIGAIDGKHVVVQAPPRSGSDLFNYKKTFSIVLMAVCDAYYQFTLVDVGDAGRQSDGGVYSNSKLGFAIDNQLLGIPSSEKLPSSEIKVPSVFVADDAFPLKSYIMKPYPGKQGDVTKRIFNYRLSRARRIIENTFGIATSRFRVFRRPIIASESTANSIARAVVALHNYLMVIRSHTESSYNYCPPGYIDVDAGASLKPGNWRRDTQSTAGLIPIGQTGSNNYSQSASAVRERYREYFNSPEGAVPWQNDIALGITNPFDKAVGF